MLPRHLVESQPDIYYIFHKERSQMPWVRFNTEKFKGEPVPAEEVPAYLRVTHEEGGMPMPCGGKGGGKKPPRK